MAKEDENPFAEEKAEGPGGASVGVKAGIRLGLMVLVLGVGSAGGYVLGGLFHAAPPADPNQLPPEQQALLEEAPAPSDIAAEDFEYVDFDPITANLNEHQLARYIRATIVLAVRAKDAEVATKMITRKKIELRDHVTSYLSGCRLEDVRGSKNLNRIRREIQERCNRLLWPRSRPLIDHVLFKDFNVQ